MRLETEEVAALERAGRQPIRLVALDIDGTLMCGGQIAPRNRAAIAQAVRAGVMVVLATVRLPTTTRALAQELGLNGPLICGSGAIAHDPAAGELWHLRLPLDLAQALAAHADAQGYELATTVDHITYFRQRPGQALGRWTEDRWIVASNQHALTSAPTRILAFGADAAAMDAHFRHALGEQLTFRLDYTQGQPHGLTIVNSQANKGWALAGICQRLSIAPSAVLAMGDSEPDIDMFRLPGVLSVAVAGAPEHVRQAARVVSPPCEAGAVAWALNTFVL